MILQAIFFYVFACVCVASAIMVIAAKNAGLFVLMGAEFLAMILIVVYVGAVAVLFLFVVMMLDVDFAELRQGFLNYLPIGGVVGIILLIELVFGVVAWVISPGVPKAITAPIASDITNTQALGLVLYTRYVYFFEVAGMILLVAMIGAIVLTLQHKPGVKRQSVAEQVARRRSTAIDIVKVKSGQGLS
jgi:NADH-quinone oxidoreductase subunit J